MLGIEIEFFVFLQAIRSGMVVFGSYQVIRIFRRMVHHSLLVVSIEDFFFWIGTSIYLFVKIYETSDGSIRWFFVLGVAVGMIMLSFLCAKAKKTIAKYRETR